MAQGDYAGRADSQLFDWLVVDHFLLTLTDVQGRNIWDLWIQSYAVRHWNVSMQLGNVLFVFHPDHAKPKQSLIEYQVLRCCKHFE